MPMHVPTLQELTDGQWEVQDLPISGNYLVTGGPGSGKTSIAIRRTQAIKKDNPEANVQTFLFTNTLNDFFSDSIKQVEQEGKKKVKIKSNINVWAKWQVGFLRQHNDWPYAFGEKVPNEVWSTLSAKILGHNLDSIIGHLIIDEAQDFTETDLEVMGLIADDITVFADPNQLLNQRGVEDLDTIRSILSIDEDDSYHLKENHRNTKEIMSAAKSFAPDEIDFDINEMEKTGWPKPRIKSFQNIDDEIGYISRIIRANRQKDIGILHLENKVIYRMHKQLSEYNDGEINFELKKKNTFDFTNTNPKLCTLDSAKGLEFDIVIMPQMTRESYYDRRINKKRIYVGMTRAREELHMTYYGYPTVFLSQINPDTVDKG